jgi:hypothetical protein
MFGKGLWKETLLLRAIGIMRIPFLALLRPRVLRVDEDVAELLAPLSYLTRNHVGSMYIGPLATGADCCGALHAARAIYGLGGPPHRAVVPIFKSLRCEFHKLADGDVLFRSSDGRAVTEAVVRADATGERVTLPVQVVATVPSRYGDEPVASFTLELSLKRKARA